MNAIKPIAVTEATVTLSRADFEALLEAAEDAEDIAASRVVEAAVSAGETECLPVEMVERLANEPAVKVWRDHRGLSQRELAEKAGSVKALKALAEAPGLAPDDLV